MEHTYSKDYCEPCDNAYRSYGCVANTSNSNPSSATPAAIDIRTTLINIIERDVPEIQYVTENRAENLVDEFLEALAAAAETVKPQKLDDQGTQVGKGWNMCVDEFDKRFAGLVGKS